MSLRILLQELCKLLLTLTVVQSVDFNSISCAKLKVWTLKFHILISNRHDRRFSVLCECPCGRNA